MANQITISLDNIPDYLKDSDLFTIQQSINNTSDILVRG